MEVESTELPHEETADSALSPNSNLSIIRGRKQDQWKGQYAARATSGESCLPVPTVKELRFYSIVTEEWDIIMTKKNTTWTVYPVSWLSTCTKFVLYPPAECKVGGKYPRDWKANVFLRHFLPQGDWEEFDVSQIINLNKPVKLEKASQLAKAAKAGSTELELANILLSESEKQYGKGHRKSKKKKMDDAEPAAEEIRASKDADQNGAPVENLETFDQDYHTDDVRRKKAVVSASTLVNTTTHHVDSSVAGSNGSMTAMGEGNSLVSQSNHENGLHPPHQPSFLNGFPPVGLASPAEGGNSNHLPQGMGWLPPAQMPFHTPSLTGATSFPQGRNPNSWLHGMGSLPQTHITNWRPSAEATSSTGCGNNSFWHPGLPQAPLHTEILSQVPAAQSILPEGENRSYLQLGMSPTPQELFQSNLLTGQINSQGERTTNHWQFGMHPPLNSELPSTLSAGSTRSLGSECNANTRPSGFSTGNQIRTTSFNSARPLASISEHTSSDFWRPGLPVMTQTNRLNGSQEILNEDESRNSSDSGFNSLEQIESSTPSPSGIMMQLQSVSHSTEQPLQNVNNPLPLTSIHARSSVADSLETTTMSSNSAGDQDQDISASQLWTYLKEREKKEDDFRASYLSKFDQLNGTIQKVLNVGLPNRLEDAASFHEAKVEKHLAGIPYDNIDKLGAMDTLLNEQSLAVSLVCAMYNKYQSETSIKKFFNQIYKNFFSDAVSNNLQWRPVKKIGPLCGGFQNLLNIITVIQTACNIFAKIRNMKKPETATVEDYFKARRRNISFKYREEMKKKGTPVPAVVEDKEFNKMDPSVRTKINQLVTILEKAVTECNMPN